jgi:hypothetical protein
MHLTQPLFGADTPSRVGPDSRTPAPPPVRECPPQALSAVVSTSSLPSRLSESIIRVDYPSRISESTAETETKRSGPGCTRQWPKTPPGPLESRNRSRARTTGCCAHDRCVRVCVCVRACVSQAAFGLSTGHPLPSPPPPARRPRRVRCVGGAWCGPAYAWAWRRAAAWRASSSTPSSRCALRLRARSGPVSRAGCGPALSAAEGGRRWAPRSPTPPCGAAAPHGRPLRQRRAVRRRRGRAGPHRLDGRRCRRGAWRWCAACAGRRHTATRRYTAGIAGARRVPVAHSRRRAPGGRCACGV